MHVECTNKIGNKTCNNCPFGYSGSGYSKCEGIINNYFSNHIIILCFPSLKIIYFVVIIVLLAQCGNNICEPELNEDCVTCFKDCNNSTCGMKTKFIIVTIVINLLINNEGKCGDGICGPGESCQNCREDCRDTCCMLSFLLSFFLFINNNNYGAPMSNMY